MSLLYYGGTDCPTCGATIPKGEPCQICAIRAQLSERDREIERLKARCWNDDMTLDMNSKASAILGKMIGESLDEAAQRVIDELSASQAREREAMEAHLRTIDQRDAAEDALSDAFRLVTGREPEWSNLFGYADAMEEITASLGQKESALAAARKALETIYLTLNQPGTPNRAFEDGIQDIARAALNGDSHAK